MKDATRRALRTLIQLAIALPTLVPILHEALDWAAGILGADNQLVTWGLAILTGVTAVTGLINTLEEKGWLRPFLKDAPAITRESNVGRTWPS